MNDSAERPAWTIPAWSLMVILALTILAFVLLVRVNVDFAKRTPGGNDFLAHWVAARSLLAGDSPYAVTTARETQERAYGRAAMPGENELGVAYPIFAEYLFVPLALIDHYPTARGIWMTVLELAALAMGAAAWTLAEPNGTRWRRVFFLVFSMTWYFTIRALVNGNAIVLVGLFLALGLWALARDWEILAGICFAWMMIKPQVAIWLLLFLAGWMLWQRRTRTIASFLITGCVLVGSGLVILPDWILQNLHEVLRYPAYNPPSTPAAIGYAFLGETGRMLGWMISGMVILILIIRWYRARRAKFDGMMAGFIWCISLAPLAGIQTDAGNELLLIIPLAWLFSGRCRGATMGTASFLAGLAVLLAGFWFVFLVTLEKGTQPQQNPILLLVLPSVLAIWMTWNEWKAGKTLGTVALRK